MTSFFTYIEPQDLTPRIIERIIHPNLDCTEYLSDCWSPEFYIALAREGFISIDFSSAAKAPLLLAALHDTYAVLDWNNLHLSRHIKKLVRRDGLDETYLVIEKDTSAVIKGIQTSYGTECWLTERFKNLMKALETTPGRMFSLFSVQLRTGSNDRLLGGELGYTIGRTYTSLTGFLDRSDPANNNKGTVQLIALAKLLRRSGYAFWNLGQSFMEYKKRLGADITPRDQFLSRWIAARDLEATTPLAGCAGIRYPCRELFLA